MPHKDLPTPAAPAVDSEEGLFTAACGHARQAAVLASVESLLGWDELPLMPPRAGPHRAEQAAALAAIVHRQRTSPEQAERLARLSEGPLGRAGPAEIVATIRLLKHDFDKRARTPARLVEELARTCVEAQQAWASARAASSWAMLEPWLERIFALKREQAACQLPDRDPYDSLMDDYEPGARWTAVAERFDRLRAGIVPLVQRCVESRNRPDDSILRRPYPIVAQQRFVHEVAESIGFDFDRGRLDTTEHPFCSTAGPDDCRITTRWDEGFLPTALYGVLHEAGHGLYEQGLPRQWFGLPPGEAASLGIHESQSRLWENLVGRSEGFWAWCFPRARAAFPEALSDVDAASMQRALMAVRPSLIRVEADEVTYNLHVMMRFDLERGLIDGSLRVADLPVAWNDRFEQDFGIRPPSDADGVLQDIHWSGGLIGYFPTYALGNICAAQLMAAAEGAIPDLWPSLAKGRFSPLLDWLRSEVHGRGRLLDSESLVEAATGSPMSEQWLLESLERRYGKAHGFG